MTEDVRFAVNLPLPGPALRDQRELVTALPDLGYADVWTGEGSGADAFTPLAAAAAWQPRLGVGAGVVPVFTRGPGVLAQTAATLANLVGPRPDGSPGRVLFGIGTSVPAHVSAINGFTFDRPVARLRDTLRFLGLEVDEVVGSVFGAAKGEALAAFGAAAYVGDHIADIEAARAGGAVSVAVATGPYTADELRDHGADVILPDLTGFAAWYEDWRIREIGTVSTVT